MITFRTSTEVAVDRRVVLILPPETSVGKAALTVTVAPQDGTAEARGDLRRHFGTVGSGSPRSVDNEQIDADLGRAYGNSAIEPTSPC